MKITNYAHGSLGRRNDSSGRARRTRTKSGRIHCNLKKANSLKQHQECHIWALCFIRLANHNQFIHSRSKVRTRAKSEFASSSSISVKKRFFIHHVPPARTTDEKFPTKKMKESITKRGQTIRESSMDPELITIQTINEAREKKRLQNKDHWLINMQSGTSQKL